MAFFNQAITVLQTLVIALGAGLGIWGVINLLEGYGNDNPGYGTDELTDFLETVKQRCQFAYWFFGHYHKNQIVDERYILQWEQISGLEF